MFRGGIGPPEILLILAVVILLFGAKKLPDLARGSGRALRIFKSETKGLVDDNDRTDESDNRDDRSADGDRAEGQERELPPRASAQRVESETKSPRSEEHR